jgi:uncharacterized protein
MTDLDPERLLVDLTRHGHAIRPLLDPATCRSLEGLYDQDTPFRKRIVMENHGYGLGEYKYFAYPLPPVVAELRARLYIPLAAVANQWRQALGQDGTFPDTLAAYLDRCHAAGQTRPTPLLLRYRKDGYNCLHQDLYGDLVFPLQAVILLSDPDRDFTGGEFILVEQRPRAQSKGEVVRLRQGEAAIFPVRERPVRGSRGYHRVVMRHGVSRLLSGNRHTLGIIFHDAA